MVKKHIVTILLCLALLGLAGCSDSSTPALSGTYRAESYGMTMDYTFTGDAVTAQFFMAGYEIGRYDGTYTLNDKWTQITFSFDPSQAMSEAQFPEGMTSLGGTFTFQRGNDYITIGNIRYDLVDDDTPITETVIQPPASAPTVSTNPDGTSPGSLRLDLPDTYHIQYTIHDEYGSSHDYTMAMIKCEEGYFFDFGASGESYIFKELDSGKYLQYQYDANWGEYRPTTLTPEIQRLIQSGVMTEDMVALDANVVSGYAANITAYFDLYYPFIEHLTYVGEQSVVGIPCLQFAASFEEIWGKQDAKIWIASETGLCMKAEYRYQAPDGTTGVRQIECTQWDTECVALPEVS